ncbi:nucleotide exchange factor GrpE [Pelagibacteraceae bacterium]|nr:nucleotide exchange factor GrpE [Pelagibacteraceae bacterium]
MENEIEKDENLNNLEEKSEEKAPENNEEKEISAADKLKETEDKLLRSLAELENQRRRFEKEVKDAYDFGGFNFAKETLALMDNLQRAKNSITQEESLKNSKDLPKFIKNIEILEKDLITIFERNKIKKIDSENKKFDPNLHQAMLEIENNDVEQGLVLQEIQPGYMFGERLLRPSFVGVSKKKTENNNEKEDKK